MAITYSQHSLLSGDDIHTIIWKKAGDTAARLALVVTEDKEGRVVLQEDNNSLWVLVDYTGPTYQEITAVGVAAVTSVFGATGDVTEADASFELADLVNVDLTGLQDDYIIKYDLGTDTWYAEADAGGGGGGTQSLDDVIRTAGGGTVDNNVIVPATDPIVLRDGAAAVSPLQVEKIEVGAGLQQPAIAITVPDGVSSGVQSQSADGVYDSTFYPKGFVCEPNPAALYSFGPRTRGGSNPGDGQDFWVGAGGGYGAGNQGGTLNLRGGPASGGGATEGIINLGVSATDTVNVSAAGKQTNIAGDLDVAGAVTGIDAADVGASALGHGHTLSDVSDSGTAAAEDVGTGPNQIVQLDGSSRLPAVDGSQLTGLTASGTIDVEEEGTPVVTDASTMNFIGSGVTATDAGGGQVNVTIAAGAAPIDTVFGRTGTVEAATSDYDASQIDNTPAGSIAATDVQAAINELDTEKAANAHTQTYSSIDGVPTDSILGRDTAGTGAAEALSAADVRTLISVQENAVAAGAAGDDYATSHDADTTAHTASEIVNTPSGTLAATDVQAALTELDTEKSATGHGHTLSDISDSGTAAALDVGTAIGDVVQLIDDAGPKLPAIDGSNLTGLPSGVNQFKDLIDTPADYATHAGEVLRVNIGETAVEFAPIAGDMVKSGTTADNQLARWDGADSNSVQGSTVTVSDAGNITVPGTVDGRNVAADGTKLDLMTVTQAVDLDTMETDVAANTAAQVNIPTADEKAALAGTGTPAVGNPYVNDDDARLTDARTPVAHTHGLVDVTDSGTAAALDAGTAIGNVAEVVDVDGNPGLAALDGSQLTGVTAGEHLFAGSGVTTATTVAEINQWGIQDANIGVIEPNGIVQLDGTGILPALDGSQLTNITAADVGAVDLSHLVGNSHISVGLFADIPSPGVEGEWYYARDPGGESLLYRNATGWEVVAVKNHEDLGNLEGGGPGEYNHLTDAELAQVPSAGEKEALAGTTGTPGTGNEYVTATDTGFTNPAARIDNLVAASGSLAELDAALDDINAPFSTIFPGTVAVFGDDGSGGAQLPAGIDGSLLENLPEQVVQLAQTAIDALTPGSEPTGQLYINTDPPHILQRNNGTAIVPVGNPVDDASVGLNASDEAEIKGFAAAGDGTVPTKSGSAISWDAPGFVPGSVEAVYATVWNNSGSLISTGAAVYVSGWKTGDDLPTIALAQADSAATMPAYGFATEDISNAASGLVIVSGAFVNTGIAGLVQGDGVWVDPDVAGGVVAARPDDSNSTASPQLIQKMGTCTRTAGQVNVQVVGAGRTNDVPYLTTNKMWKGDADGVAAEISPPLGGLATYRYGGATGDPAAEQFRSNSATMSALTELRISETPTEGGGASGMQYALDNVKPNDVIVLLSVDDPTGNSVHFLVSAIVDSGSFRTITGVEAPGSPVGTTLSGLYSLQVVSAPSGAEFLEESGAGPTNFTSASYTALFSQISGNWEANATYLATFSAQLEHSAEGATVDFRIEKDFSADIDLSTRTVQIVDDGSADSHPYSMAIHTQGFVTLASGSALRVVFKTSAATATVSNWSLVLQKCNTGSIS